MEKLIVKVMKNGLGEWGVWWGLNEAKHLAYKRFFKTKEIAEKWKEKFIEKLFKN